MRYLMSSERATNGIDRILGQRVRRRRLELGMSQEQLADELGITFQQVQEYEKGANRIAASRLLHIAEVLGLPAAEFFVGLASRSGADKALSEAGRAADQVLSTAEGQELMTLFGAIADSRVRKSLLSLTQAVVAGEGQVSPRKPK